MNIEEKKENGLDQILDDIKLVMSYDKKYYNFDPKKDITAYELSLIIQLFLHSAIAGTNGNDSKKYIDHYNLNKHFTINREDEKNGKE